LREIGVDQTWQDVTGSRASGVTYTNTTGKPISIYVDISNVAASLSIDGVILQSGTTTTTISAIVPDSATYVITSSTINRWSELR